MFAIESRLKDGTLFLDIQFCLSQSVHLIVLGREVYSYAHIYVFVRQALCLQCMLGPRAVINICCVECCLEFSLGIPQYGW